MIEVLLNNIPLAPNTPVTLPQMEVDRDVDKSHDGILGLYRYFGKIPIKDNPDYRGMIIDNKSQDYTLDLVFDD